MKKSNTEQLLEAGIIDAGDVTDEVRKTLESLNEQEVKAIISVGKKLKGNPSGPALKVGF